MLELFDAISLMAAILLLYWSNLSSEKEILLDKKVKENPSTAQ